MAETDKAPGSPSLLFFFITTTIYSILSYYTKSSKNRLMLTGVYFLIVVLVQYYLNLGVATAICGVPQYGTAAMVTFVPWVIMFGLLKVALTAFPGWLAPFSNTFGYLIASLAGLKSTLSKILAPQGEKKGSSATLLNNIYSDPSLMLNELTMQNIETWWQNMSNSDLLSAKASDFKEDLISLVRMKNIVSEYIWFLLTGTLISSVSYNYTVGTSCVLTPDEISIRSEKLRKAADEHLKNEKKKQEEVYTTSE